jgi:GntR family transcriptional regulator
MAESKYRLIADKLREDIGSGVLRAGDQLPTEFDLAATWHASRSTVREAIATLAELGLVEARPGQGTFVTEKIVPFVTDLSANTATLGNSAYDLYSLEVRAQGRSPRTTVPKVETHLASGVIARALELAPGSQVVSRHQQRFIDDKPYSMQTSFYAMDLVTVRGAYRLIVAENIPEGTAQYLRNLLATEQAGYVDVITIRAPNWNETEFFKLPEDGRVPVFENFRTLYDQHGDPIRISVTVYPTDRNQFVIDVELPDGGLPAEAPLGADGPLG